MGVGANPRVAPSPGGIHFLLAQKKNKKKCNRAALTTPVDALRKRRGEQRVGLPNRRLPRSNSSPLLPVAEPSARQSGDGIQPLCLERHFKTKI